MDNGQNNFVIYLQWRTTYSAILYFPNHKGINCVRMHFQVQQISWLCKEFTGPVNYPCFMTCTGYTGVLNHDASFKKVTRNHFSCSFSLKPQLWRWYKNPNPLTSSFFVLVVFDPNFHDIFGYILKENLWNWIW